MNQNNFPENLIKGRIAETVFEQMFRQGSDFDIYPLGYEYTIPILRQFHDHPKFQQHKEIIDKILRNFNNSPDFLFVKPDKSNLFVVEVKYLEMYNQDQVMSYAEEVNAKWDPAWLFLATKSAFYFDSCNDIIHHKPNCSLLGYDWISDV